MEAIVIRGKENAGKTTTAIMAYEAMAKDADAVYLFDHYNNQISEYQYHHETGEVLDFKAILRIKSKIIVVITAGDEVWRLMINIDFLVDFVNKIFKVKITILICCGRSVNRRGSVVMTLQEKYQIEKLEEVWVYRVEGNEKENSKRKAVDEILSHIA